MKFTAKSWSKKKRTLYCRQSGYFNAQAENIDEKQKDSKMTFTHSQSSFAFSLFSFPISSTCQVVGIHEHIRSASFDLALAYSFYTSVSVVFSLRCFFHHVAFSSRLLVTLFQVGMSCQTAEKLRYTSMMQRYAHELALFKQPLWMNVKDLFWNDLHPFSIFPKAYECVASIFASFLYSPSQAPEFSISNVFVNRSFQHASTVLDFNPWTSRFFQCWIYAAKSLSQFIIKHVPSRKKYRNHKGETLILGDLNETNGPVFLELNMQKLEGKLAPMSYCKTTQMTEMTLPLSRKTPSHRLKMFGLLNHTRPACSHNLGLLPRLCHPCVFSQPVLCILLWLSGSPAPYWPWHLSPSLPSPIHRLTSTGGSRVPLVLCTMAAASTPESFRLFAPPLQNRQLRLPKRCAASSDH